MRTDVFSADILADVDASSVIPRLPHSSLKNGGVKWNICLFSCRFLTVDNTNPDILFASSFILIQMTATVTLLILFVPKVSAEKHCRPLTFVTRGGHVGQRFRNLSLDLTCMVTSSSRAKKKFSVPRNSIWPPCDKSPFNLSKRTLSVASFKLPCKKSQYRECIKLSTKRQKYCCYN